MSQITTRAGARGRPCCAPRAFRLSRPQGPTRSLAGTHVGLPNGHGVVHLDGRLRLIPVGRDSTAEWRRQRTPLLRSSGPRPAAVLRSAVIRSMPSRSWARTTGPTWLGRLEPTQSGHLAGLMVRRETVATDAGSSRANRLTAPAIRQVADPAEGGWVIEDKVSKDRHLTETLSRWGARSGRSTWRTSAPATT